VLVAQALRIKREIFSRVGVHNVGPRKWSIKQHADENERAKKKKRRKNSSALHDARGAHLAALILRGVIKK
jgi:hypothetical protein